MKILNPVPKIWEWNSSFPFPKVGNEIPHSRSQYLGMKFLIPVPNTWEWNSPFPFPILGNVSHSGTLCGNVLDVSRPVSDVPGAQGEPKRATKTKKSPEVPRTTLEVHGAPKRPKRPFWASDRKTESPLGWCDEVATNIKLVGANFYAFCNYALVASIKHWTVRCWYLEIFVAFEKMVWRNQKMTRKQWEKKLPCKGASFDQSWSNSFHKHGNVVPGPRAKQTFIRN